MSFTDSILSVRPSFVCRFYAVELLTLMRIETSVTKL